MNKRHNKGFTLVEMLVATIIMVMVTLCVATGASVSQNVYQKSMFISESATVSSTLNSAIGDVLHYAVFIETTGGVVRFSNSYYAITSGYFHLKDGRIYITPTKTLDEIPSLSLLGKSAYTGLQIKDFTMTYAEANNVYSGTYTIFHPIDNNLTREISFTYRSLLPKQTTTAP